MTYFFDFIIKNLKIYFFIQKKKLKINYRIIFYKKVCFTYSFAYILSGGTEEILYSNIIYRIIFIFVTIAQYNCNFKIKLTHQNLKFEREDYIKFEI